MHHIFIGLGGTGVRVWQAMERRRQIDAAAVAVPGSVRARTAVAIPAAPVLLIDTDASLHDDEAPGWCLAGRSLAPPRAQRLLLASPPFEASRAELLAALSSVIRTAEAARTLCMVHLIAHPGEPVGAGLLVGVLDALCDTVPPARLQLHLTLSEQTPVLAVLQQRAEAVPPRFDRCWLSTPVDEGGARETDAALRQERQAQWLLQAWAEDAPVAARPAVAPRGEFALWGIAEWRSDLVAVQRHLGHALMLRLLAQLRFDHWRPSLGYVNHPAALRTVAGDVLPEDPLSWPGVSPGDAAGPPPPTLAAAQQAWQRLAAHYLQLVQHCAPAQRRAELRRLFALGLSERFGGAGVAAVFDVPAAALRQRAMDVRTHVEVALWHDWRLGSVSLRDGVARVAALVEQAEARQHDLEGRQARDDRLVTSLRLQIDAEAALSPAAGRWFGPREDDLHPFALRLQAWAQATTAQAHTALLGRQWAALRTELADLQDMVEAADLALAALAGEADETAAAVLAPPVSGDGFSLRLDTREQVRALGKTWVLAEAVQRESVAFLRADLFMRLGDGAGFRLLAQHLGERAGCARLLAASTQRLAPSVVASAAQSAMLALARAWQEDPAARPVALQRLRSRAGGGAWSVESAGAAPAIADTLRLPLPLLPALSLPPAADVADPIDPAEAQRAATAALRRSLQAAPMPWPTGAVDVLLAAPGSPAANSLVWCRQIAPVPLAALCGLQAPEPAAADHAPDSRPGLLLLGDALGLVREDLGAGVVLVRLDGEGFEADRVPLGAHWDAAATGMPEPVRCWLQEDVDAALRSSPIRPDRLREVMQRRVAQVLAAASPDDADGVGQRWPAAIQTAMHLLPA
ncbi:hypothetical protein [Sphaerotilus sp.]|uniref:hypothetical protein n=1 Tax=Sphaerotilus sp. TaxID=2093942 RepID=UPI0034E271BF